MKRLAWVVGIGLTTIIIIILSLVISDAVKEVRLTKGFSGNLQTYQDFERVILQNFPIRRQQYPYSCGPTTISMVYSYLESPKSEQEIEEDNGLTDRENGMLPSIFQGYLSSSLPSYNVVLTNDITDAEVLKLVYEQISNGLPVPIYFSTINEWDIPNYDTHYSVITGIDMHNRTVFISNAYGYDEEISFEELFNRLKYYNYKNKPIFFSLAQTLQIIKQNNLYILAKK